MGLPLQHLTSNPRPMEAIEPFSPLEPSGVWRNFFFVTVLTNDPSEVTVEDVLVAAGVEENRKIWLGRLRKIGVYDFMHVKAKRLLAAFETFCIRTTTGKWQGRKKAPRLLCNMIPAYPVVGV